MADEQEVRHEENCPDHQQVRPRRHSASEKLQVHLSRPEGFQAQEVQALEPHQQHCWDRHRSHPKMQQANHSKVWAHKV